MTGWDDTVILDYIQNQMSQEDAYWIYRLAARAPGNLFEKGLVQGTSLSGFMGRLRDLLMSVDHPITTLVIAPRWAWSILLDRVLKGFDNKFETKRFNSITLETGDQVAFAHSLRDCAGIDAGAILIVADDTTVPFAAQTVGLDLHRQKMQHELATIEMDPFLERIT